MTNTERLSKWLFVPPKGCRSAMRNVIRRRTLFKDSLLIHFNMYACLVGWNDRVSFMVHYSSSLVIFLGSWTPVSTPKASIDKKSYTMSAAAIAEISARRGVRITLMLRSHRSCHKLARAPPHRRQPHSALQAGVKPYEALGKSSLGSQICMSDVALTS